MTDLTEAKAALARFKNTVYRIGLECGADGRSPWSDERQEEAAAEAAVLAAFARAYEGQRAD